VTSESAGLRIRDVGSDIGWCRSRGIPQCWLVVIAVRDADGWSDACQHRDYKILPNKLAHRFHPDVRGTELETWFNLLLVTYSGTSPKGRIRHYVS
jgi:hypothetical protein